MIKIYLYIEITDSFCKLLPTRPIVRRLLKIQTRFENEREFEREIEVLTRLRLRRKKSTPDLRASPETIVPTLFHPDGLFAFPSRQEVSFVCNAFSLLLPFETSEETTLYYIDPVGKEIMSEISTL